LLPEAQLLVEDGTDIVASLLAEGDLLAVAKALETSGTRIEIIREEETASG
jgi:hypothetical protein